MKWKWIIIPVCFAEVLEVVHVATSGRVLSVFSLPLFGITDLKQVSVVLYHILAFLETTSGKYRSPFSLYVLHLQKKRYYQDMNRTTLKQRLWWCKLFGAGQLRFICNNLKHLMSYFRNHVLQRDMSNYLDNGTVFILLHLYTITEDLK